MMTRRGGTSYEWSLSSGPDALARLAPEWQALDGTSHLFARYEWHKVLVSHLLPQSPPAYVRVSDGARCVAIIPLFRDEADTPVLGSVDAISSGFHLHAPFFDFPVALDACARAIARALEQYLEEVSHEALVWRRLAPEGNAMRVACALRHPRASLIPWKACPVIDTRRTYDAVIDSISTKLRVNMRRNVRKLQAAGGMRF